MSSKFQINSKRVFLDCRHVNTGGIGVYIEELMPRVVSLLPEVQFTVLESTSHPLNMETLFGNVQSIRSPSRMYSLREQIDLVIALKSGFDLAWIPHFTVPFFYTGKLLATIHDTFHLSCPQISSPIQRIYVRLALKKMSKRRNRVLTVSEFSKAEIRKYSKLKDEQVVVAYNGSRELPAAQEGYAFKEKFILFVGNLKPHKNLKTLVSAFSKLPIGLASKLVVVGSASNLITRDTELNNYVNQLGDRLVLLGRVEDGFLGSLYKQASLFVAPSRYEGFGLTPLEAALHGAPVLISAIPPHKEIFGESISYFDPQNEHELLESMISALKAPVRLNADQIESLRRQFDWEVAAQKIAKVIEEEIKI